jgi:uncharacterized heparinase superfamily protein
MLHPDGRIPFFNDATFEVAPEPGELFAYAERLGVVEKGVALSESGYVRLENEGTVVLFDAAPAGPDYQPGHAHADTLSFELSRSGKRVVVNSGTSTYEKAAACVGGVPQRTTRSINGQDSSEVWSAFRVAHAYPFDVKIDRKTFVELLDGYKRRALCTGASWVGRSATSGG